MRSSVELLAPAGDFESFKMAIEYGADAVYIGAKNFSARQSAANFDSYELEMAIDYAHVRDAKVYVAMNTIVSDSEMSLALEDACSFYNMGADGIIIQDIGFAASLSSAIPGIPIHASTQMTIFDSAGVRKCKEMGFKRVVLARELSLSEIKVICDSTDLEIEIFVHGALCISYSGQCLFSSLVGGRSGNRGKCAQSCRLPYELCSKENMYLINNNNSNSKGHFLSPKDLCTLSILPQIIDSGVKSLKIEGRMKSPQYVGSAVDTYRRYIDNIQNNHYDINQNNHDDLKKDPYEVQIDDVKKLSQVFNRGGFTTGYFEGESGPGKDMMCFDNPKNMGLLLGTVEAYDSPHKRVKIKIAEDIAIGDGVEFIGDQEIYASTIVTWISTNGRSIKEAFQGDTVEIGDIKGKILKGMLVYKTSDKALNTSITSLVSRGKSLKKIYLNGEIDIYKGKEIIFKLQNDDEDKFSYRSGEIAEESVNNPANAEKVTKQLKKTGDTPFEFDNITVNTDGMSYVSASAINSARRSALEGYANLLTKKQKKTASIYNSYDIETMTTEFGRINDFTDKLGFSLYLYNALNVDIYKDTGVKRVYIPISKFLGKDAVEGTLELRNSGVKVFMAIPVATGPASKEMIANAVNKGILDMIDGVLISNPGHIEHVRAHMGNIKIVCDYTFNVFNSKTTQFLCDLGLKNITYSPELNLGLLNNMDNIKDAYGEIIAYGRIPVMNTKYCAVGCVSGGFSKGEKCSAVCLKGKYYLKDRIGAEFPIISDRIGCNSIILNSKIIYIPDEIKELSEAGIKTFRINVYDETRNEILDVLKIYSNSLGIDNDSSYSEGGSEYNRILQKLIEKGITKGHLFRGV